MTTPPGYGDLGKAARDLFSKGFNYGKNNLEIKTKSALGVEFKATASNNHDSGKFGGNLETKLKCSDYNITAKEVWSTDNTLGTEIEMVDPARGLKLVTEGAFNPQSGKKTGIIKSNYKREYLNTSCDIDLDLDGPVVHGSAVTEYKGWLAGYQMAFDTAKTELSRNNFAFGYKSEGTELHTSVNDGTEFGASIYQKVNDKADFGTELAWSSEASTTKFGIALKYMHAPGSIYRAKLNNAMQIGLSYQHEMSKGVTMTVSTLIEGNSFNAGGHKMGFGLEMDL